MCSCVIVCGTSISVGVFGYDVSGSQRWEELVKNVQPSPQLP